MIKDPEERKKYFREYRRKQRAKQKQPEQVESQEAPTPVEKEEIPVSVEQAEQSEGFYQIIAGERRKRDLVVHSVLNSGTEGYEDRRYTRVRAAWVPMRPDAPSVYIIAAEQWIDKRFDASDRGCLVTLKEVIYEGLSTDTFVRKLFADATLNCFNEVYVDLENPLFAPFFETFRQAKRGHSFPSVDLVQAPFSDNILAELSLVSDWRKKDLLEIDPSLTAFQQVKNADRNKLTADGTLPAADFFALECLCHLVGGFHSDPPPRPPVVTSCGDHTGPQGWMKL